MRTPSRIDRARVIGLSMLLLAGTTRSADAQICAGRAPFNLASTQFALDAGWNRAGQGIGFSAGHGIDQLFGIGTLVLQSFDEDSALHMITGTLGTDQPLSPDNRFHVCPTITMGYISGPHAAPDVDGRFGLAVAGDASLLVVNGPRARVTVTIGLDLRKHVGRSASLFVQDARETDHTFSGGIGFLLANRWSVVSRAVLPFGSISDTGLQVTFGYNLRRR